MIIDLGNNGKKLRFDENDVRVSIDGDIIDVGARREEDLSKFEDLAERAAISRRTK